MGKKICGRMPKEKRFQKRSLAAATAKTLNSRTSTWPLNQEPQWTMWTVVMFIVVI